jgi:hypothetical protein
MRPYFLDSIGKEVVFNREVSKPNDPCILGMTESYSEYVGVLLYFVKTECCTLVTRVEHKSRTSSESRSFLSGSS